MKISHLVSVSILSLGLAGAASAKVYRIPVAAVAENADGNYASLTIDKGVNGTLAYELVPATTEVATKLQAKACTGLAKIDGSILSRTQEIDEENQRMGMEHVKLLVRSIDCGTL
jgi:hypothetical protein